MTTAADTIRAAAVASLPTDVTVYDAIVPGIASAKYVCLYVPDELRADVGIVGVSDYLTATFHVMTVVSNSNPGYAAAQCRWLSRSVRDIFTDLTITADGMLPARIKHVGSQQPQPDELTPDKKVYSTAQFSYESVKV